MKVYIDAACDIHYSSFYIYGLYSVFGKENVNFSSEHFKSFKHNNHFFSFVVKQKSQLKKVVIDFTDSSAINELALEWCDVYGKINLEVSINNSPKIKPIGPSFGIKIFNIPSAICIALYNLLFAYNRIPDKRKFLSDYKAQLKRLNYKDYMFNKSKDDHVFFMASLWKQESETNTFRSNFIKVCKSNKRIKFEGGFAPRTKNDILGFEDDTVDSRIDLSQYISKIRTSSLVFNTPAVKDCHGWKLAEFMCLGKAILSTPLSRELPSEIKNEEHVLFTTGGKADLAKKIEQLLNNNKLKNDLELNSRKYYEACLSPQQVIRQLLDV